MVAGPSSGVPTLPRLSTQRMASRRRFVALCCWCLGSSLRSAGKSSARWGISHSELPAQVGQLAPHNAEMKLTESPHDVRFELGCSIEGSQYSSGHTVLTVI